MDRRVARTITLIKKTFLDMVQKMPLKEITIVALSRTAGINRRTFYMHYDAVEDLIEDIEKDCVYQIEAGLSSLDADDMEGGILVYYRFLEDAEPGIQTLLYGRDSVMT